MNIYLTKNYSMKTQHLKQGAKIAKYVGIHSFCAKKTVVVRFKGSRCPFIEGFVLLLPDKHCTLIYYGNG